MRDPVVTEPAPRWAIFSACGVIVLAGLAAYANTFTVPFVLDDPSSITNNSSIRQLWPLWGPLSPPHGGGLSVEGRPLLNLSLALNYAVSGTNVWSYHALNLAIHLLAGLTLFGVVRRTLERFQAKGGHERERVDERSPRARSWLLLIFGDDLVGKASATGARKTPSPLLFAFAVALLWTLHPLQTESVTYVIQRAESLMGFFYLLTLYGFVRGTVCHPMDDKRTVRGRRYWLTFSFVACALGMATKEVMVTAPVIVLLYDCTFVAGGVREAWRRRRGYYAALVATWLLLLGLVLGAGNRGGTIGSAAGVAWWEFALTQARAIPHYLALTLWPRPLIFDYGSDFVARVADVVGYALLDLALLAATVFGLGRRSAAGFLGACFFVMLSPSSSVIGGTRQMLAEHRMYLPLAAVVVLALLGLHAAFGRRGVLVSLMCAVALAGATVLRNADYRDPLRLWSDTVAKRPGNAWAQNNLGMELLARDRDADAADCFAAAVRLDPNFANAHANLGNVQLALGRLPESLVQLEEARRLAPRDADVRNNLANAFFRAGRGPAAITLYEEALALQPTNVEAHNNLGNALAQAGRSAAAIEQYRQALLLDPGYAAVQNNWGNALVQAGRPAEAVAHYESALRLSPDYPEAHFNLANVLAQVDRLTEAIRHYEDAVRLRPGYAAAQSNLGNALARGGRLAEALPHYEAALRINPADAVTHYNLGNALLRDGRVADAVAHLETALQLQPDFPEARDVLGRVRAAQLR